MPAQSPLVAEFKDIDKNDLPLVGGKGANLGEMTKAGFPIPQGFAVTVNAYDLFLKENNLHEFLEESLKDLDVHDSKQLQHVALSIQKRIEKGRIPDEIAKEVFKFYKNEKLKLVAVRSSATAEDLPDASFAGQQASFLNVKGEANLLEKIRLCWASLFTARAIFYREENKIKHEKVKISVIVQKMVESEVSGVLFTIDPITNDKESIVIEAVWGLGETIVQGQVVPDRYVVQKDTFSILSKEISDQATQLIRTGNVTEERKVPKKLLSTQKLKNEEIITLAKIADKIHKHYYFPQDIEWAREKNNLYIVQSRPVTTTGKRKIKQIQTGEKDMKATLTPLLSGASASPGIASGKVKITKTAKEIDKVKDGDVLVSTMTSPDFVPAMKRAAAIITDKGGQTSHAAIVSRELGIPCVVGTKTATQTLKEGDLVTVDGAKGVVYKGSKIKLKIPKVKKEKQVRIRTATNLYINLAEKERAKEMSEKYVDGVGLLRAEFMIANIGMHPKEAIKNKKQDVFIKKLTSDISTFCKHFYPRPVVYRTTDFKTNEYKSLPNGKYWEPDEPNPMLGFRGAFRYVTQPEVFNLELRAIKKVREKYNNLWVMIPFVRSPEELSRLRRLIAVEDLFKQSTFKLWMMVELPVNVILLDKFIDIGIDGVSIGSNDLTMLIQGTDRDNSEVAEAFDEKSPAVLWAIKKVIKTCHKRKITSSICGQAPSYYDDLVKKLVKWGITSVSVNPDAINRVRRIIADTERDI